MDTKQTQLAQARIHAQVGNHVAAVASLECVLASEPGDFEALGLKASFSRHLYPSFNGTNHEYIIAREIDRISPVLGNFRIAVQFCPPQQQKSYLHTAAGQLSEYALAVVREDAAFVWDATARAMRDSSVVYRNVLSKAKRQLILSKSALVEVGALLFEWEQMTSEMARSFAEIFKSDSKAPNMAGLYERIRTEFPELQLKEQGCFPAEAKVLTPTGLRAICDVEVDDFVISYGSDGRTYARRVIRKFEHGACEIQRVTLHTGTALRATANHRVLTSRGWVKVGELRIGAELIQPEGRATVLAVERERVHVPVYNLHTDWDHTFIVDGVVVHNFAFLMTLRTWLHRVIFDRKTLQTRLPEGSV